MGTSVALWLDGFVYDQIPQGLGTFTFLATSQQADLKSQDEEYAYRCLLPCWRQDDLFALGRAVFNYSHDDMVERFYYSGGSVRYFALPKIRDIKSAISHAVSRAIKTVSLEELLSISTFVSSGDTHVDRIRHTFLRETGGAVSADKLLYHDEWEQVVDSKYAVSLLSVRFTTADALYPIYEMARRSGYASLADGVFEMYLHRLAGEKMLRLFVSEYRTRGESNGPRYPEHFQPLYLQSGDVQCSGKKDDYVDALTTWRDSKEKTYWYPDDRDFPNIDSIVKRAAYGTASDQSSVPPTTAATLAETCDVAYLQITVAATHSIDGKQLEEMNKIFKAAVPTTTGSTAMAGKAAVPMRTTGSAPSQSVSQVEDDRPMYVAVCPDKASCDQLDLTKAPDVLDARRVCRVYVGYYQHAKFVINAGGRDVPCLERPKSPRRSERLLEKKPRVDDQSRG